MEISKALLRCGWDAAEYRYVSSKRTQVKTRSFLGENEFFEPYDSFRYSFSDLSDDDAVIYDNIASLGAEYELAWKRILLADAFFMNTDRHMRNFGVIRSAKTGKLLRLAPNFDNNQAYLANPSGKHSDAMLKMHMRNADSQTYADLRTLLTASQSARYLSQAVDAAQKYL